MSKLHFVVFMGKWYLFLRHLVVSRSQDAGGCSAGDVSHALLHQVELSVAEKNLPPHARTRAILCGVVAVTRHSNAPGFLCTATEQLNHLTLCTLSRVSSCRDLIFAWRRNSFGV